MVVCSDATFQTRAVLPGSLCLGSFNTLSFVIRDDLSSSLVQFSLEFSSFGVSEFICISGS